MDDIRCWCDEGILQPSKLPVHDYKKAPDENLFSCMNCSRCFLVNGKNEIRIYPTFVEYRYFLPTLRKNPNLTERDVERFFVRTFDPAVDMYWKAFRDAFRIAQKKFRESQEKEIHPSQRQLFGEDE